MEEKIGFQLFQVKEALKKDSKNEKLKRMAEKMEKLLLLYKEKSKSPSMNGVGSVSEENSISTTMEKEESKPKQTKEGMLTSKIPLYKRKNTTTTAKTTKATTNTSTAPKSTEQQQSWQKFKNSRK